MVRALQPGEFERRVLSFEEAWQSERPPAIADFLPSALSREDRRKLLFELVCLDVEFRWRRPEANPQLSLGRVEDYLRQFPELGDSSERVLELITEEYRARHAWGDQPSHAEFLARYGAQQKDLAQCLQQVDRELEAECETDSPPTSIAASSFALHAGEAFDPRAPLPYADYVLRRFIGAGRMGKVYQAWQRSLDRPVAVKYLRKSFLTDQNAIRRFLEEARTVARFQHPNIIGVHGLGRTPAGGYFLVMDWIDGPDLAEVIQHGAVPIPQAVRWTIEACDAIETAHDHGIVHCDLKPGNILLAGGGRIRVTDFGLARSLADESRTDQGIEGTAPFMAPEQVSADRGAIGPRTDVYGLGAVLFTLLTGRPPWTGKTLADVLAGVVSATPAASPESLRRDLPSAVVEACQRSLAKPIHARFPNVADLRQALELCEIHEE